jgi:hypothetical protein
LRILTNGSYHCRWEPLRSMRLYLHGDLDLRIDHTRQTLDYLLGDLLCVARDSQRVEFGRGVKTPRRWWRAGSWYRALTGRCWRAAHMSPTEALRTV